MKFYEKFFGYDYPFSKYDQIFCPEYNVGAMENVGCVTFNDLYVFREAVDVAKVTRFSNTITHELSHHWFGNLVTMKWWNDLWLNESFADFISHFALSNMNLKSFKLGDIWIEFNARKGWGYRCDQLKSTHPIAGEVVNT
jgi:aminopeptidase N